jgi:hypothetical protein
MVNQTHDDDLAAIEKALRAHPGGASAHEILLALATPIPLRTLQYRLKNLAGRKHILKEGGGRSARYRLAPTSSESNAAASNGQPSSNDLVVPISAAAAAIRDYVRRRPESRKPVGYDRAFLDDYRPNVTWYLSEAERRHLAQIGRPQIAEQPAGTYAKQIMSRLLIDLAWNSSRLEGNTYSLLDTKRLIELGEEAEGRGQLDAQMILNHKDAIEFLVTMANDIGFNRYTVLNLHALLANNLLTDPTAAGRLRYIAVGIERSAFYPLEVPQLIEECFDQILATAAAISDPFEQALFIMVQLPYLQPFDDVNKRVSRLAANIPLIKNNLSPLSFTDVPRQSYTEAVLGIYEMNKVDLLKDVFVWAYQRSAARYAAVRQSLGEPDPFRLRHRAHLREIVSTVVRGSMNRKQAVTQIADWSKEKIDPVEQQRFIETTEAELMSLHEGNFARYQVRPSEFASWRKVWEAT